MRLVWSFTSPVACNSGKYGNFHFGTNITQGLFGKTLCAEVTFVDILLPVLTKNKRKKIIKHINKRVASVYDF